MSYRAPIDMAGNNAVFECLVCQKPFVVSGFLHRRNGRLCPHCEGSRAYPPLRAFSPHIVLVDPKKEPTP